MTSIPNGSESILVDPNLQTFLQYIVDINKDDALQVIKKPFLYAGIVKSVQPKHCIWSRKHNLVLVASEAKGLEASIHQCVGQLLIACGDSALYLQMLGLDLENCVVPGIAISDTTIRFGAVYLIPHSFPVFLFLSDMLHPLDDSEMVACWFFRLSAFSKQTEELLNNAKVKALRQESKESRKNQPKKRSKIEEKPLPIKFDEQKNFLKPIREGYKHSLRHGEPAKEGSFLPGRLWSILRVYNKLYTAWCNTSHPTSSGGEAGLLTKYSLFVDPPVLFPTGVILIPRDQRGENHDNFRQFLVKNLDPSFFQDLDDDLLSLRPCLIFPRLEMATTEENNSIFDDSSSFHLWRSMKPPRNFCKDYLAHLESAIQFLNEDAEVAHFDLRPSNILWRIVNNNTQFDLKIIDFDDSFFFDEVIPQDFVKSMETDSRFPFDENDSGSVQLASPDHNLFFLDHLKGWLNSTEESFSEYMQNANRYEQTSDFLRRLDPN